jgi:hypothetical protein
MKRILAAALSLVLLGLSTGKAPALGFFHHCCCDCCATICCKQYNAFTPACFGTLCCNGCCPIGCGNCGPMVPGNCGPGGCGPAGCPGPDFGGACYGGACAGGSCGPDCSCDGSALGNLPAPADGSATPMPAGPSFTPPMPTPTGNSTGMMPLPMPQGGIQAAGYYAPMPYNYNCPANGAYGYPGMPPAYYNYGYGYGYGYVPPYWTYHR